MRLWRTLLGKPERDDFARIAIRTLQKLGERKPISYDPADFKLIIGEGPGWQFFLGNVFKDYLDAPRWRRREVIEKYALCLAPGIAEPPASLEDALPDILPVVRSRAYFDVSNLRFSLAGGENLILPYQQIGGDLAVGLCYDRPDALSYLNRSSLENWHVSFTELLTKAMDNLWQKTTNRFETTFPGVFALCHHDTYDASRVLFWEIIIQTDVKGTPVVAVPDRDTLIITGSEDRDGLDYMASACEGAFQNSRLVSTQPLILENKIWTGLKLAEDHPCYSKFRMCEVRERMIDYTEQQRLLEELYQKMGEDVFVASYVASEHTETGKVRSHCVWVKDIVSDLPRTDRIYFMEDEKKILGWCPWEEAVAAFGELMAKRADFPERFRVVSFPSPEQLARVRLEPLE